MRGATPVAHLAACAVRMKAAVAQAPTAAMTSVVAAARMEGTAVGSSAVIRFV